MDLFSQITDKTFDDLLSTGGQIITFGTIAYWLIKLFIKQFTEQQARDNVRNDEDRKWIRDVGEKQMVTNERTLEVLKELSETNSKLAKLIIEKGI